MIFTETKLKGAYIIDLDPREDARGFFAHTYVKSEFAQHGLETDIAQCNLSFNHRKGTVRGLHYQIPPAAETKLVRCVRGAIADVFVDLRPNSPTYLQHLVVELTAENRRQVYVPKCFAHGYQALTDGAEACYQTTGGWSPPHERGLRFDDPMLRIEWPTEVTVVSDRDRKWDLLTPERVRGELGVLV